MTSEAGLYQKGADFSLKKGFVERMFGWMLPKGMNELPLAQLNFGGIGAAMMKSIMKNKKLATLDELHDAVAREVDEFAGRHLAGRPSVGVHLRGSDKITELPMIDEIVAAYPAEVRRRLGEDPGARLFVITDSGPMLEEARKLYGDRVVAADCVRTGGPVGLHHLGLPERRRLGVEVVRDVLVAARCDQFVGLGWSNVTNFTRYFKDWPEGAWAAMGPPGHGMYAQL